MYCKYEFIVLVSVKIFMQTPLLDIVTVDYVYSIMMHFFLPRKDHILTTLKALIGVLQKDIVMCRK